MMKIDRKKTKYYKLIDIVYDIDTYYKENFYKLQFLIFLIRVKINKRS